nr:hypothetical protein StreXyl84_00950 [Streptomyces sp. Xyl84]
MARGGGAGTDSGAGAGPSGGPAAGHRVRRSRRRGCFRWILLTGLLAGGFGLAGEWGMDDDPMVDLAVVDGSTKAGPCTVVWKDPFTKERRRGPFFCSGHRDPLIPAYEVGFVVSYGPWKGDLYNSELKGSPSNDVVLGLQHAAELLVLAGGIGGAFSVHHRRRRQGAAPARARTAPARPGSPYPAPLARRAARASLVWAGRARRALNR